MEMNQIQSNSSSICLQWGMQDIQDIQEMTVNIGNSHVFQYMDRIHEHGNSRPRWIVLWCTIISILNNEKYLELLNISNKIFEHNSFQYPCDYFQVRDYTQNKIRLIRPWFFLKNLI